jgi:hypothetical protein
MYQVFFGTDTDASRKKLNAAVTAFAKKYPYAERVTLEGGEVVSGRLAELAGSQGLFSQQTAVVVRESLTEDESRDAVLRFLKELAHSPNSFFFWERGALDAKTKAAVSKHASEVMESSPKKAVAKPAWGGAEAFALADALGRRDKKQVWVLLVKSLWDGKAAEEIHGMLFWQVKAMLAASQSKTPADAGLSPFPYKKASEFARNYTLSELQSLSSELVKLYHEARRGGPPLETALERWVLTGL